MRLRNFYRRLVPFGVRFRVANVRSALALQVPPEESHVNTDRWFAERGDDALLDLPLTSESVAVDVGAYLGKWSSDIFGRFCCRVIALEPVPQYARQLRERFASNEKIEVQERAIGASTRLEKVSMLGVASSSFRPGGESVSIRIVDAKEWFEELGASRIDVMAINCEGGEYEILPRIVEAGLADKISNVLIQFHLVGPDPHLARDAIRRQLAHTHEEVFSYPFVWELWRRRHDQELDE